MSAAPVQGFRIAVRECDDGWIRAYVARPDSMKDAVLVAVVSKPMCELDEAVFDQFKALCRLIAGAVTVDTFGVAPAQITEEWAKPPSGGPKP